MAPNILRQVKAGEPDEIRVALLGAGAQGQVLMQDCLKIPGVRFKAVCDIWEAYNQGRTSKILNAYGHTNNAYVDYKEMLDKEAGNLDAVIVATPDFWHAEHAIACMEAGLHVYCEKEMSNELAKAKQMVEAQKATGKLLQIGHQRRSNPRYIQCYEKLIKEAKILGRPTTVNGQWNRSAHQFDGWPTGSDIPQATLEKYGFKSMEQFRNWRWFKGLGGGPIVDLGSHQIDVYNWFLEAQPRSVIASGGTDYYDKGTHQWYDTVMAIYEYETAQGVVRAFYQTLTTNSCQGYYESFLGDEATLMISEAAARGAVYKESTNEKDWSEWVKRGYLLEPSEEEEAPTEENVLVDVRESPIPPSWEITATLDKKAHQPHLENFFNSIRGTDTLNCPAEIGYETAVTVLKVNEAVEAMRRLEFKPEEFKV